MKGPRGTIQYHITLLGPPLWLPAKVSPRSSSDSSWMWTSPPLLSLCPTHHSSLLIPLYSDDALTYFLFSKIDSTRKPSYHQKRICKPRLVMHTAATQTFAHLQHLCIICRASVLWLTRSTECLGPEDLEGILSLESTFSLQLVSL